MSTQTTAVSSCTSTPPEVTDTTPELEFFNSLSGTLEIELTVPAEPGADTYNLHASPEARVANLRLHTEVVYDPDDTETTPMSFAT